MTYLVTDLANEAVKNDVRVNTLSKHALTETLTDQPENLSSRRLWTLLTEHTLTQEAANRIKAELVKRKHLSLFEERSALPEGRSSQH